MQTLYQLYLQNPFWIWMAVGAVFVALDIATGRGELIWPGVAAAVLAFVNLAGVRLGAPIEIALFVAVSIAGVVLAWSASRRRPRASRQILRTEKQALPPEQPPREPNPAHAASLIGRIGRTTGEFVNGVGRVWIDGAEWAAEIDGGDDGFPPDAPVRVIGVTGGVRLHVRGLTG